MANEKKSRGIGLGKTSCSCGSSDARELYQQDDGSIDSYCFSCHKYFNPVETENNGTKVMTIQSKPKTFTKDMNSIPDLPVIAIDDRGIRKEVAQAYDVHVEVSPEDASTIVAHYYPDRSNGQVVGYEVKIVEDKQFVSIGDRKGNIDLWGSHLPKTGKKLFITEGRLDALSLYQTIVDNTPAQYAKYTPSVVSLTRGSGSAVKDIMASRDFVETFEEVILCFDMDEPGRSAVKDVLKVFPFFKVAKYPLKDASDMLMAGKGKELYQACVWDSAVERQGQVVDVHDFIEKAMEKPQMGISFPWATVTKACFGIRPHTIHVVGAAPKIGKTDHEHQLVHHLVYKEKVKVGVFDLENSPVKTAKETG